MKNAEAKGEEGEVDEAQELFQQAETLQQSKAGLEAKALQVREKGQRRPGVMKREKKGRKKKGATTGSGLSCWYISVGGDKSHEGTQVVEVLTEEVLTSVRPPPVAGSLLSPLVADPRSCCCCRVGVMESKICDQFRVRLLSVMIAGGYPLGTLPPFPQVSSGGRF